MYYMKHELYGFTQHYLSHKYIHTENCGKRRLMRYIRDYFL